jgi:hypothetical protein
VELNLDKYAGKSFRNLNGMSLVNTVEFFNDCKNFILECNDKKNISAVDKETLNNSISVAKEHLLNIESFQEVIGASESGPNPLALTKSNADNSGTYKKFSLTKYFLEDYIKLADEILVGKGKSALNNIGIKQKSGGVVVL